MYIICIYIYITFLYTLCVYIHTLATPFWGTRPLPVHDGEIHHGVPHGDAGWFPSTGGPRAW